MTAIESLNLNIKKVLGIWVHINNFLQPDTMYKLSVDRSFLYHCLISFKFT